MLQNRPDNGLHCLLKSLVRGLSDTPKDLGTISLVSVPIHQRQDGNNVST
jgi:hypothetical protein